MNWSRWLLAVFFVGAGAGHFLAPEKYLHIMPPFLPWPEGLVAWSGIAEIAGGVGILLPLVRRAAGWGLIALLICVFPANVHAISAGMTVAGREVPTWLLWARLPFQAVFIAWVYYASLRKRN